MNHRLTLACALLAGSLVISATPSSTLALEPDEKPQTRERGERGADRAGPGERGERGARRGQRGPRGMAQRNPGQMLELIEAALDKTDLEEAKRVEIAETINDMSEQIRELLVNSGGDRQAVRGEARQLMTQTLQDVRGMMDGEQQRRFMANLRELRQNPPAPTTQPTTRPGANAGPGGRANAFAEAVRALELDEVQQTRVDDIFTTFRAEAQRIGQETGGEPEEMREAIRPAMRELRESLMEVLTPEQQRELMQSMRRQREGRSGEGGERRRGRRDRGEKPADAGALAPKAGAGMMAEFNRDEGEFAKPTARTEKRSSFLAALTDPTGLEIGEELPDLTVHQVNERAVELRSFLAPQGTDRPLVVILGSGSSPTFRERCRDLPWMIKQLRVDSQRTAEVVVIYTREQYPAAEWQPERNVDDKLEFQSHGDLADRATAAKQLRDWANLRPTLLLDGVDNAVLQTLAGGEVGNPAFVFTPSGKLVARQQWFDPTGMIELVELARGEAKQD